MEMLIHCRHRTGREPINERKSNEKKNEMSFLVGIKAAVFRIALIVTLVLQPSRSPAIHDDPYKVYISEQVCWGRLGWDGGNLLADVIRPAERIACRHAASSGFLASPNPIAAIPFARASGKGLL